MFARPQRLLASAGLLLMCALAIGNQRALGARRPAKCQADECELRDEHFKLYSSIKRALESNFNMKGKDIIPLARSVEVLRRRFEASSANQPEGRQLNGTRLVLELLKSERLNEALEVFRSEAGRQLVALYKASINGQHQNLACSQWRVEELELAGGMLAREPRLARVFASIHRNFLERSARKCLKSACSSLDDNMNRLDAVQRHSSSRRKGFMAREELASKLYEGAESASSSPAAEAALTTAPSAPATGNALPLDDELAVQLVENEPAGEFKREELELCQFFKRTNDTRCQASANELGEISFVRAVPTSANVSLQSSLDEFLADYRRTKLMASDAQPPAGAGAGADVAGKQEDSGAPSAGKPDRASSLLLGQCRTLQPSLEYHTFALRWYQRQALISAHKLRARTFWCPSLAYWLEIERLCNELELKLAGRKLPSSDQNDDRNNHEGFAY